MYWTYSGRREEAVEGGIGLGIGVKSWLELGLDSFELNRVRVRLKAAARYVSTPELKSVSYQPFISFVVRCT